MRCSKLREVILTDVVLAATDYIVKNFIFAHLVKTRSRISIHLCSLYCFYFAVKNRDGIEAGLKCS